jgi:putative glutamine amidotransferase
MHNPIKHNYYPDHPRNYLAHKVEISSGNKFCEIFGSSVLEVNSLHHQGVNKVADDLNAIGFAPDGLVEVLEVPGHKFGVGVQWHPECLTDQSTMQQLFNAFTDASRGK